MTRAGKSIVFTGITFVAFVGTFLLLPRFDLPTTYHDFADKRLLADIPNFGDVVSNLAFFAAGLYGIAVTLRARRHFEDDREIGAYLVLFAGIAMTAFGSAYYHLAPSDSRLFWDRLPMTVGFMGLFSAIIAERVSVRFGNRLLPLLIACGAGSLIYWYWTVQHGNRDLRPYAVAQAYPVVATLLLIWMFPPRYSRGKDFLLAVSCYAAAKVFEVADKPIFSMTGNVVSGHTLKHVSAALAGYWLARMLVLRKKLRVPAQQLGSEARNYAPA